MVNALHKTIMELSKLKAWELKELLLKKEISSVEVVSSIFDQIKEKNERINAYISLMEVYAKNLAREIDEKRGKNQNLGILAGIPIAIKDNICAKGFPTTCGSMILENFIPPYDATVIEWLKKD